MREGLALEVLKIVVILAAVLLAILLDARKKVSLMRGVPLSVYFLLAPNSVLLGYWLYRTLEKRNSLVYTWVVLLLCGILGLYLWLRLNILPTKNKKNAGLRLNIMLGGRFLAFRGMYVFCLVILSQFFAFSRAARESVSIELLIWNLVFGVCFALFVLANGCLRMFFTSRRLSFWRRLLVVFALWIPFVNFVVLWYTAYIVKLEYDYDLYMKDIDQMREESDICKTRYPLVLIHGVLWRDLYYFNYWGRIPKALRKYGSVIYYGHQEAAGSIEQNGKSLADVVLKVVQETGCEKVNIIAHSKGGLDARYTINMPGMDRYIASLTSLGVPHRGSPLIDLFCWFPDGLYRFVSGVFDFIFKKMGDKNPDVYLSTRQISTKDCERFNREVPDSPNVYYQSYASVMKNGLSDLMLALPYWIVKVKDKENDGLVSLSSAPWGEFRGVFRSTARRGVSHGDMIDLKREDYKGFDVLEMYISIVSDLKNMGF